MRLFLLPISARRSLIYCDKHFGRKLPKQITDGSVSAGAIAQQQQSKSQPSGPGGLQGLVDRASTKAATTWTNWEKADGGWKKSLTSYGNALLRRIPYEEWGLKSLPPITQKRREQALAMKDEPVKVLFPGAFLKENDVPAILKTLATERQDLHRKRMIGCMIGAPLTLPFALVPVLPNIPGFYLLFRAYSHWRALYGARHLEFLVQNNLIKPQASTELDSQYTAGQPETNPRELASSTGNRLAAGEEDCLLLNKASGSLIASSFEVSEMAVEIERAVEQVEKILRKKTDESTANSDKKAQ